MKRYLPVLFILFLLQSCIYGSGDDYVYHSSYAPVTQPRSQFEKSLELLEPREAVNSGKIYIKDDLIYLNEVDEGFHIIDNSNPEAPEPLAFLKVPLSTDLAIRNNTIYVHHAVDLVAFTYSLANNKLITFHRERNVFPALQSPEGFDETYYEVPEDHVVVGYQLKN